MTNRRGESGNVFFTLFGAVALVGVIGVATSTLMRGPVGTVVTLNQKAKVESQLQIARKLAALDAATTPGDCDGDGMIEAAAPDVLTAGCAGMITGGGCLPAAVGASKTDPWGTLVGYCGWDHTPSGGSALTGTNADGCPGGTLRGEASNSGTVLAVISAGPDRTFQTTCGAEPAYVAKGGDDIVFEWTYEEASTGLGGGLWSLMSGTDAITTDKDITIGTDATFASGTQATFQGDVGFGTGATLDLSAASLFRLPTQANSGPCNGGNSGILRVNSSAGQTLQICDPTAPGDGWVDVGGSGAATSVAGSDGDIQFNSGDALFAESDFNWDVVNNRLTISRDSMAPANTLVLDVEGAAEISSNLSVDGNIYLSSGSAGFPSYSFDGSNSWGFYQGATGIGTSIGGNTRLLVTNTGADVGGILTTTDNVQVGNVLYVSTDAEIGDDLLVVGDINVGGVLFSSGAPHLRVGDSFNVSGEASFGSSVFGAGTVNATLFSVTGTFDGTTITNGDDGMASDGAGGLELRTGAPASRRLHIDSAGDIGIALAGAPTTELDVNGILRLRDMGEEEGDPCTVPEGSITYGSGDVLLVCSQITGEWESIGTSGGGGGGSGSLWQRLNGALQPQTGQSVDDFLIGSTDPEISGTFMHFDRSKGAFRAGTITGGEWLDSSRGIGSIGLGADVRAAGVGSVVLGNKAAVDGSGDNSFAFGLGNPGGAAPRVSGTNSFGIFMGDQSAVNLADNNVMLLAGGRFVVDPDSTSATNISPSNGLAVDVQGSVGAMNFCNENGTQCFTAADITGGVSGAPGNDREVLFNSNGRLWTNTTFVFTSAGRMGVGTLAPNEDLTVGNSDGGTRARIHVSGITGTTHAELLLNRGSVNKFSQIKMQTAGVDDWVMGTPDNSIVPWSAAGNQFFIASAEAAAVPAFVIEQTTLRTGIGVAAPATKLDVNGTLKIAYGGETCAATTEGAIHYNSTDDNYYVCPTNGGGWQRVLTAGGTGGVTAAGANTQIQYNSGGLLYASSHFALVTTGTETTVDVSEENKTTSLALSGNGGMTEVNDAALRFQHRGAGAQQYDVWQYVLKGPQGGDYGKFILEYNDSSAGIWHTMQTFAPDGNIAMGASTTPRTRLDVDGTIKMGFGAEACDVNREGAIHYNSTDDNYYVCPTNGGGWQRLLTGGGAGGIPNVGGDREIVFNSGTSLFSDSSLVFTSVGRIMFGTPGWTPQADLHLRKTADQSSIRIAGDGTNNDALLAMQSLDTNHIWQWELKGSSHARYRSFALTQHNGSTWSWPLAFDEYGNAIFGGRQLAGDGAKTRLDVVGTIKMSYGAEACDANREGAIHYNSTNDTFFFCAVAASGWQAISLGGNLDGLSDVTIATPLQGQVLYYSGTQWVNATLPSSTVAAAGGDRQLQFNSNNTFSAHANLVYTTTNRLGVNKAAPAVTLDVGGPVRLEYNGEACNAATEGAIHYNSSDDTYYGCATAAGGWRRLGAGSLRFTDLADAPQNYTGAANNFVRVNAMGTGVVFSSRVIDTVTGNAPLGMSLDDLSDVVAPSPTDGYVLSYSAGQGGWIPVSPGAGGPGTAGGSDRQVQFNSGGGLMGTSSFIYSATGGLTYAGADTTTVTGETGVASFSALISPTGAQAANKRLSGVRAAAIVPLVNGVQVREVRGLSGYGENYGAGNVENLIGTLGYAYNAGTGTASYIAGVTGVSEAYNNSGTTSSMIGGEFYATKTGTAVVPNAYGVYTGIENNNASGAITNAYGLYLSTPITTGAITNRWGVYQQDPLSRNAFAGSMTVGSVVNGATALDVAGTIKMAYGGETCDASREGAIHYNSSDDSYYVCPTNGGGWRRIVTGTASSGGTPAAGLDRQLQFNSNGSLEANANLVYTTTNRLGVNKAAPAMTLDVGGPVRLEYNGETCVAATEGAIHYNSSNDTFLACSTAAGGWRPLGAGSLRFTDLLDVPNAYTGQAGRFVKVNSGATALEFSNTLVNTVTGEPAPTGMLLDDLGDVTVPSPTLGYVLTYSTSGWVAAASGSGAAPGADRQITFNSNNASSASANFVYTTTNRLGVNKAAPAVTLDVGGPVRLEYNGETCVAATEGAIHYNSSDDTFYSCSTAAGGWRRLGAGSLRFTDLFDAPQNYTAAANNFVRVNSGGTGVIFSSRIIETVTGQPDPNFMNLSQLGDVSVSTPTDGYVLTYSSGLSRWVAAATSTSGGTIDGLTDGVASYTNNNVFLGTNATGALALAAGGLQNVGLGVNAADSITTGDANVAIGYNALTTQTISAGSVAIGAGAAQLFPGAVASEAITAVGYNAAQNVVSGFGVTALGYQAMSLAAGNHNTALGYNALYQGPGDFNVGVGGGAGNNINGGDRNVFLGEEAGFGLNASASVSNNTILGQSAAHDINTGANNNVIIGQGTAATLRTGAGNIVIGQGRDVPLAATSNYINIGGVYYGSADTGFARIGGGLGLSGVVTAANITANTDNYNPANLSTATVLRLNATGAYNLTGVQGGESGRILTLVNVGTNAITLVNDATSTAANRFLLGSNMTLLGGQSVMLMYDSTNSRWRALASFGTGVSFPLLANPVGSATAPAYSFNGDTNTGMYAATAGKLSLTTAGVERIRVTSVGMSINQAADPTVALDITGDIEYTGVITDVSDIRLKTDIAPLRDRGSMLDRIGMIDTYSFRMKDDELRRLEFGVMAQELEKVFPELVNTAPDAMGTKSVNYIGLIAPMIEASKELKAENDNLRAEIATLRAEREEMHAALDTIATDIKGLKAHTGYGINRAEMGLWMMLAALGGGAAVLYIGTMIRNRRNRAG